MTLNVSVIGCGTMGKQHAAAWQAREDARVVSVFDPVAESRDALAGKVGAKAYDHYQAAIDQDGVNVVSVCTPLCFHREVTCYAAERGRHILCEKPLAGSVEECDAMVEAARRHGVHLCVNHQYRSWPRNQRVRQAFAEGSMGSPLLGRYTFVAEVRPKVAMHRLSMNKGPVMDMVPHVVDLMRFFTGAEPTQVYASGAIFGRGKARLSVVAEDDFAVDAAQIQVRYEGGHVLSVGIVWGMPEAFPGVHEERIIGPKGMMQRCGGGSAELVWGKDQAETLDAAWSGPESRITDLASAITAGMPLEVSGEDGRISARVALAALESIASGQVVNLAAQNV